MSVLECWVGNMQGFWFKLCACRKSANYCIMACQRDVRVQDPGLCDGAAIASYDPLCRVVPLRFGTQNATPPPKRGKIFTESDQ